jgi:hypothetical protein
MALSNTSDDTGPRGLCIGRPDASRRLVAVVSRSEAQCAARQGAVRCAGYLTKGYFAVRRINRYSKEDSTGTHSDPPKQQRSALVCAPDTLWLLRVFGLPHGRCTVVRVRSADTCADQPRRHQPADARADDLRAHARADLIADVFRRCAAHIHSTEPSNVAGPVPRSDSTVLA